MNPSRPQILFVTWRDAESRKVIPIGRLLRLLEGYEFAYIGAVRRAQERGFAPLATFPSLETVYQSTQLPPLFSNRLMPASRPDFAEHVGRLALRVDEAEPFTVLARSAGRRETDQLEVFALPQVSEDVAEGLFLARGLRHIPGAEGAAEQLQDRERLFVMADAQNEINPAALALRSEKCSLVGFVPDYLAQELASNHCPNDLLQVHVVRVNPQPAPLHHRLLCRFEYRVIDAPGLFTGPDYQPLSNTVSRAPASAA